MRALAVLLTLMLAAPAMAQEFGPDGSITIMRPEPGTSPDRHRHRERTHGRERAGADEKAEQTKDKGFGVKEDTRRGSSGLVTPAPLPPPQSPLPVPHQQVVTPRPVAPPPLYVPQTGQVLPNLPTIAPSGPHGQETYQDRAVRCAHQAGVYGANAGSPAPYINSCINQ